jgi:hypothetical protein
MDDSRGPGGDSSAFSLSVILIMIASRRRSSSSRVASSRRKKATSSSRRFMTASAPRSYDSSSVSSQTYTRPSSPFSASREPRLMRCLTPSEEILKASAARFTSTRRLIVRTSFYAPYTRLYVCLYVVRTKSNVCCPCGSLCVALEPAKTFAEPPVGAGVGTSYSSGTPKGSTLSMALADRKSSLSLSRTSTIPAGSAFTNRPTYLRTIT